MQVRTATERDLPIILNLGEQFGHQMLYQKDAELMEKYLPRILVTEVENWREQSGDIDLHMNGGLVGYYHYIVAGDPGFVDMLRCYRQIPENLIYAASLLPESSLCVIMQGGCHREAFKEMVTYLQSQYPTIWCWNSITNPKSPSSKIAGYKELGFKYGSGDQTRFFNVHKGDYSTYCLGRWSRK